MIISKVQRKPILIWISNGSKPIPVAAITGGRLRHLSPHPHLELNGSIFDEAHDESHDEAFAGNKIEWFAVVQVNS